ncbi:unnamed protein product [Amoebophrya sp. A120]|nr:unnamed protein product [Amoebophrya sp. A120]|eukprot:GSA120T00005811001.1
MASSTNRNSGTDYSSFANWNPVSSCRWNHEKIIGAGKHKFVKTGTYENYPGRANSKACVVKLLKTGANFSSECFHDDVRCAEAALPYIEKFHEYFRSAFPKFYPGGQTFIKVNVPTVWQQINDHNGNRGQKILVEPLIPNFTKFNSNSGKADARCKIAQALSHFSYHASDGREILCDLQGGRDGKNYVLSDVVVMSADKKYGITDLGLPGIENFCAHHVCNCFCSRLWKTWSGARRHYQPEMCTTITLDVEHIPVPLSARKYQRVFPSDIMFTQKSIKDRFHDGNTLLYTALTLARQEIQKSDIPMITVVQCKDGTLRSLDNRRLAVFRLLGMTRKIHKIKVEIVPVSRVADEYNRKFDGGNGEEIHVRQSNQTIGRYEWTTKFRQLAEIKNTYPSQSPQDAALALLLGSLTDE